MINAMGQHKPLSRGELRRLFKRHHGSITALALELGVTQPMVSYWLRGRTKSARVAEAAQRRGLELMARDNGELMR